MDGFFIKISEVKKCCEGINDCNRLLNEYINDIESVKKHLRYKIAHAEIIESRVTKILEATSQVSRSMGDIETGLQNTIQLYQKTENSIINVEGNIMEEIKYYAAKGGTNSQNSDNRSTVEYIDKTMDAIDNFFEDVDAANETIKKAILDAIECNGVVAIGVSGDAGVGGGVTGGAQIVIDMDGNMGLQFIGGAGISYGSSATAMANISVYPGMENITDAEGIAWETGASAALGYAVSGGLVSTAEDGPIGATVGIGVGGGGDVHMNGSMTSTTIPLGNVLDNNFDKVHNAWKWVYKGWNALV